MYAALSSMRRILINNVYVSSSVTANNIKVGFQKTVDTFPCIAFYRIGGSSLGMMGYNTSTGGTQNRMEDVMLQVDIFHLDSTEDLELLDDQVIKAVMSGAIIGESYDLIGDSSSFDNSYDCYRVIQTWRYSRLVSE